MAATLIMYYEESSNAMEALGVTGRMREAMMQARFATSQGSAHQLLCMWGQHVKLRFTTGNVPIAASGSADSSGAEPAVAAVQRLAATAKLSSTAINRALLTQTAAVAELP